MSYEMPDISGLSAANFPAPADLPVLLLYPKKGSWAPLASVSLQQMEAVVTASGDRSRRGPALTAGIFTMPSHSHTLPGRHGSGQLINLIFREVHLTPVPSPLAPPTQSPAYQNSLQRWAGSGPHLRPHWNLCQHLWEEAQCLCQQRPRGFQLSAAFLTIS